MRGLRAIQSNAASKHRLFVKTRIQDLGPPPPKLVRPPLIGDGFWVENPYTPWMQSYNVAPNMTLTVEPSEWDETGGTTTLTGQFVLDFVGAPVDGFPVGEPNATTLVVTPDMLGKSIYYRVRAIRGGVTVDTFSPFSIEVVSTSTTLAQFTYTGQLPLLLWKPGQAIAKPTYQWRVDPAFGSYTRVGSWWKNGVNTGVTTETYSDTQDGDIVTWIESLVSEYGITASMPAAYANANPTDGQGLKHRVNRKAAEVKQLSEEALASRAAVSLTGAAGMEVFSTKDPAAANYVVNDNNWLRDLYPQLCGIPAGFNQGNPTGRAWQVPGGWGSSYGNTLITPRHVITSGHTQTAACHGGPYDWRTMRWVLDDNTIVEARIVAGSTYNDPGKGQCVGFPSYGIHIGLLDRDVQALGVPVLPIINLSQILQGQTALNIFPSTFYRCQSAADRFGPHQVENYKTYSMRWAQGRTEFAVAEDYPILHENMFWSPNRPGFRYYYFGGDSGTPQLVAMNDTAFLYAILSGSELYTDAGCDLADTLIGICDARGVALGAIDQPTGHTVKRCYDPANPKLFLLDSTTQEAILISAEDPTPLFDLPD